LGIRYPNILGIRYPNILSIRYPNVLCNQYPNILGNWYPNILGNWYPSFLGKLLPERIGFLQTQYFGVFIYLKMLGFRNLNRLGFNFSHFHYPLILGICNPKTLGNHKPKTKTKMLLPKLFGFLSNYPKYLGFWYPKYTHTQCKYPNCLGFFLQKPKLLGDWNPKFITVMVKFFLLKKSFLRFLAAKNWKILIFTR